MAATNLLDIIKCVFDLKAGVVSEPVLVRPPRQDVGGHGVPPPFHLHRPSLLEQEVIMGLAQQTSEDIFKFTLNIKNFK